MDDTEKLRQSMYGVALGLSVLVGLPVEPPVGEDDKFVHEFDSGKRADVSVRREAVPEIMWRGAIMALDYLTLALGVTEGDPVVDVSDESLARLTDRGAGS